MMESFHMEEKILNILREKDKTRGLSLQELSE